MNRKILVEKLGGFWGKVLMMSLMMFFAYLGDAILSDWVPSYMQEVMKSALLMGIVMSFSSVIGFLSDLLFPQLLRKFDSRKLMLMSILTSLFFGVVLWGTLIWPVVILFLVAMAIWGVYYEFLNFGTSEFVSVSIPAVSRSAVWAIMGVFRSIAYFIGPILGSWLALSHGNKSVLIVSVGAVCVSLVIWFFVGSDRNVRVGDEVVPEKVNVWMEMKHWVTLFEYVWPVLTISFMLGLMDSTFWTTGTVLSDKLALEAWWGGMFLPFYTLPMIFVGFLVAKWGIYKGKKKMAEVFLLVAGLSLSFLYFANVTFAFLLVSLMVGAASSVVWPLTDAVYSDIVARMKSEGKHMIGLSVSMISVAYIVGPILVGILSEKWGEKMTFVIVGVVVAIVALFLLKVTPKKIRMPESEIQAWD